MDVYEVVKLLEEKKYEKIKEFRQFKHRDIYYDILFHIKMFEEKRDKTIFLFYGLRGIGKTVALTQAMRGYNGAFIDGSILNYYGSDLVKVAREYLRFKDYKIIYIDEVNEIKNWDQALKILYDHFNVKIIATGSSAVKLKTNVSKILRRAEMKNIPPLTFKEFLRIKYSININQSTEDIFKSKPSDAYIKAKAFLLNIKDFTREYREYLKFGFPLAFSREITDVAESIVEKILVDDFPSISGFNLDALIKAKKLINFVSISKPEFISLSKFSKIVDGSKTTISNILNATVISSLFLEISQHKKGASQIRKEKKYLFSSSALRFGLSKRYGVENIGAMREDAFISSMFYNGFNCYYIYDLKKHADYIIEKNGIKNKVEIGGSSKDVKQLNKGFVLKDGGDLDYRNGKVILPLYLSGLI